MKIISFLILISAIATNYRINGYRLLGIFPSNSKSHFVMFEAFMKNLASNGHHVDVISSFPLKKPHPNYTDLFEFTIGAPQTVNNMSHDVLTAVEMKFQVLWISKFAGKNLCEGLALPGFKKLIHHTPKNRYDAVITEIFGANCFFAFGEHFRVPLIAMSSSVLYPWSNDVIANPENLAYQQNNFLNFKESLNFQSRVYNVVHTLINKLLYNYLTGDQDEVVKRHFGAEMLGVRQLESKVALLLVNSHPTMIGNRPVVPAFVEVAGLHVYDDETQQLSPEVQKWLDESTSGFVYFSFGSMVKIESFPNEFLMIFYESLRKIAPVRVLIKIANPKELPAGLPKNVITHSWLSQIKVLKHKNCKAFITHGGLMGTQEAITYGVPMIGLPLFADQFINVDSYVHKKLAIRLDIDDLTVEKLDDALNNILNDPIYSKSAKKFQERFLDRPLSAMDTAIYWTEYVIRHGSDSLRSPAMKLAWWQLALLDVYFFLLLVTISLSLVLIYTIKFTLSMISQKLFFSKLHTKID